MRVSSLPWLQRYGTILLPPHQPDFKSLVSPMFLFLPDYCHICPYPTITHSHICTFGLEGCFR